MLLALGVAAGVGYAGWSLWRDPGLAELPRDVLWLPLVLALLIRLASLFESALVWLWIFRGVGGRLGLRDACRIYLVTNVAKYVPGKVMLVASRVAMLQEHGQPAALGLTGTVLELAFSLMAAAVMILICVPVLLWDHGLREHDAWVWGTAVVVLTMGLIGLHPRVLGPVLQFGAGLLPRRLAGAR